MFFRRMKYALSEEEVKMILENANSRDGIWTKQKLGDYVSQDVVWSCPYFSTRILKSVEEINELDRMELSWHWWNSFVKENPYHEERVWNVISDYYGGLTEFFIDDVAVYIDMRLPQAYLKHKEHIDAGPSQIKICADENGNLPYGIKYKYKANYNRLVKPVGAPATDKQLSYIEYLADKNGYHFNHNEMTLKEASSFITFLKNIDSYSEPDGFNLYFSKNSC